MPRIIHVNTNLNTQTSALKLTNLTVNNTDISKTATLAAALNVPAPTVGGSCGLTNAPTTGSYPMTINQGSVPINTNGHPYTFFGADVTSQEAMNPQAWNLNTVYNADTNSWSVKKVAALGYLSAIAGETMTNGMPIVVVIGDDGKFYHFDNTNPDHIIRYRGLLLLSVTIGGVAYAAPSLVKVSYQDDVTIPGVEYFVGAEGRLTPLTANIVSITALTKTFIFDRDITGGTPVGGKFTISGTSADDGTYTVVTSNYDFNTKQQTVVVSEAVPSDDNTHAGLCTIPDPIVKFCAAIGDEDNTFLIQTALNNNINPMTRIGDIIYGGIDGVPTKLDAGTEGQVLTAHGAAAPSWATPSGGGGFAITNITRDNFVAGITAGVAIPLPIGLYRITDYITEHEIPYTSPTVLASASDLSPTTEPIIVCLTKAATASADGVYNKQVFSEAYPDDIIYWTHVNGAEVPGCTKGFIFYRKNVTKNVETYNDFRNIVYRRWLLNPATWAVGTTYNKYDCIGYTDGNIYVAKKTGIGVEPTVTTGWDAYWLMIIPNYTTSYVSWTPTTFTVGDVSIPVSSSYKDFNTFISLDYVHDFSLAKNAGNILNNIIFNNSSSLMGAIAIDSYNCNIGNANQLNLQNGISSSIVGNGCILSSNITINSSILGDVNISVIDGSTNIFIGSNNTLNLNDINSAIIGNSNTLNTKNTSPTVIVIGNSNQLDIEGGASTTYFIGNSNVRGSIGSNNKNVTIGNTNIDFIIGTTNNAVNIGNGNKYFNIGNNNISVQLSLYCTNISIGNTNTIDIGSSNNDINIGNGNIATISINSSDIYIGETNIVSIGTDSVSICIDTSNHIVIGDNCTGIYFGENNTTISVGNECQGIRFESNNSSITLPAQSQNNKFLANGLLSFKSAAVKNCIFYSITSVNFTSATHVYSAYHCELQQDVDTSFKVMYLNSGVLTVANANA